MAHRLWIVAVLLSVVSAWAMAGEGRPAYPETRREDRVEVMHGTKVADPYRWLETDVRSSQEVAAWIEAQNLLTRGILDAVPARDRIRERLTALWNYERTSAPYREGNLHFFFKNDGLQDQSVLHCMEAGEDESRVLLDPNAWSADGTVSLSGAAASEDGRYLAYGLSEGGSDWETWRILEIETGKVLPDELRWVKWSAPAWTRDGRGFFYSRYDAPEEGAEHQAPNLNHRLWYHRVGTGQAQDVLCWEDPDHPDWGFNGYTTFDGRWLVITVWTGTEQKYRVLVRDLLEPFGFPEPLVGSFDHDYSFVESDGHVFYFRTDRDAPRGRVIAVDRRRPEPEHWREVIPQREETLRRVSMVGNLLVARYLKDARTQVRIFGLDGSFVRDVEFPDLGSAWGFGGQPTDRETFYSFASFNVPPSIYRYDMLTGKSTLFWRSEVKFNPGDFEIHQVFYPSADGERVPMFLAHRKGVALDGTNATLLTGYGGFGISLTPYFSVSNVAWMEMGGVFAMANLRGGGEYGRSWHEAGKGDRRQRTFDDFIAAAEWLVEKGYTKPGKLAIQGGSNGGLLVAAVLTQRPALFGACLPSVPLTDMLRYHRFTSGRFWTDEFGSADDPDQFQTLRAYSPYHNVKAGTRYPAVLVTTADTDDRVVPAHGFKFVAALQHAQGGDAPVLIRVETRAGHGGGKPVSKAIDEITDEFAFLVKVLDMKLPD